MAVDEHAWLRWIGVLSRSRANKHATLPASLPSLPCVLIDGVLIEYLARLGTG
jgi:hypothetical protein